MDVMLENTPDILERVLRRVGMEKGAPDSPGRAGPRQHESEAAAVQVSGLRSCPVNGSVVLRIYIVSKQCYLDLFTLQNVWNSL